MNLIGNSAGRSGRHAPSIRRRTALLALLLWGSAACAAQLEHGPGAHEPLSVSSELGWQELIEATLLNYPRYLELAARDAEARALAGRGGRWLSGPPAAYAVYLSDRALEDTGMVEYEFGLELPLWRSSERSAARRLGAAAGTESTAASAGLRHRITGLLRGALWDIEKSAIAVKVAEDDVAVATELLRIVTRRQRAGDLPLTDALLARSALLEREAALIESGAALVDAERAYRSLTGLDRRPASVEEAPQLREALDATHPWLAMADAELARAEAELAVADNGARGAPVLALASRRERASFTNFHVDSVGLQLRVPFGGAAHRRAATTRSLRAVSAAQANRAELARQLELELHEAHHRLTVVAESLELAREQADIADRSLLMSERAFAQGEMTLLELLLQQDRASKTRMRTRRLEVERQRAIAEINQALGEGP